MPPVVKYSPNETLNSLINFTGRTNDIDKILKSVKSNKSVAILGERRIGKTMVVTIIESIINRSFDLDNSIDKVLVDKVPEWQKEFKTYKAILVNLQADSSEKALIESLRRKLGADYFKNPPETLHDFFENLSLKKENFIFLIDEMESLATFSNFRSISDMLKEARNNYKNIEFIHTGSYKWDEEISKSSKNATWFDLQRIYIKEINKEDALNFLIQPLAAFYKIPELSDKIIKLSGTKPLLIQIIGQYLSDYKNIALEELNSIIEKEERNYNLILSYSGGIVDDNNLNNQQKKILALLCHNPGLKMKEIAQYDIDISEHDLINALDYFGSDYFGTLSGHRNNNGDLEYSINGQLIETYGKRIVEPVNKKKRKSIFPRIMQFVGAAIIIILGVLIYLNINPEYQTEQLKFGEIVVTLIYPSTLEYGEKENIQVDIRNMGKSEFDTLDFKLLSDQILFYRNSTNNTEVIKLKPNHSRQYEFSMKVIKKPANKALQASVFVEEDSKMISKIELRKFRLKYYWGIIYGLFALGIFLIFQYKMAIDLIFKLIGQKVEKLDIPINTLK